MAKEQEQQSLASRFLNWVRDNHERQPSLGAEVKAMGREAIKDVRNTIHETFFGKPEHMAEPGAPLNPTPQETTMDRGTVQDWNQTLDTYAARGRGQDQSKGLER